ncbi:MAG: OadG family protein [Chloroflexi bacterium]|nr:OadG family protein [Chloroflexota bacterium]
MNYSWQNVIDGNGIGITLTGMLIVFSGLALISLFITALPRVLDWGSRLAAGKDTPSTVQAGASVAMEPSDEEIMAALALVLHLELQHSLGEDSKVTISRQQRQGSIWASAGKMRSLSEGGSYA